jgi:uncharacterized damage-inducible protein DinB
MEAFFVDYLERLTDLHNEFTAAFSGLPQEALDWVPGQEMNSLVVLVVHVTAAERYWVGTVALSDPAPRDRDAEFRARGLSETELIERLAESRVYITMGLERITTSDFGIMRLSPRHQEEYSVGWALLHALEHTGLHLGHAQITRQLWEQRRG